MKVFKKIKILKRLYRSGYYNDNEHGVNSLKSKIIEETRELMRAEIEAEKRQNQKIKINIKQKLSNIKDNILKMLHN